MFEIFICNVGMCAVIVLLLAILRSKMQSYGSPVNGWNVRPNSLVWMKNDQMQSLPADGRTQDEHI